MNPRSKIRVKLRDILRSHIAQQIKSKRTNSNMTQRELATIIGYEAKQNIENWERGYTFPPFGVLYLMSIAFDSPIEDFFLSVQELQDRAGIILEKVSVNRIVVDDENSEAPQ